MKINFAKQSFFVFFTTLFATPTVSAMDVLNLIQVGSLTEKLDTSSLRSNVDSEKQKFLSNNKIILLQILIETTNIYNNRAYFQPDDYCTKIKENIITIRNHLQEFHKYLKTETTLTNTHPQPNVGIDNYFQLVEQLAICCEQALLSFELYELYLTEEDPQKTYTSIIKLILIPLAENIRNTLSALEYSSLQNNDNPLLDLDKYETNAQNIMTTHNQPLQQITTLIQDSTIEAPEIFDLLNKIEYANRCYKEDQIDEAQETIEKIVSLIVPTFDNKIVARLLEERAAFEQILDELKNRIRTEINEYKELQANPLDEYTSLQSTMIVRCNDISTESQTSNE